MSAPGSRTAEEKVVPNFTVASQNLFFLLNSASQSFLLPVELCTHSSAYWLDLFEATDKKKGEENGEEEIFPCHNGIDCGSPEEEGLRGLYGSVGAVLCGEWIQQVPAKSRPTDRSGVARDNVAFQQLNSGGFGVV